MNRPKIFMLEPTDHFDFSGLKKYGDVVFLFNGPRPSIFAADFPDVVVDRLVEEGYNPSRDYLGLAGILIGVSRFLAAALAEWSDAPGADKARAIGFNKKTGNWASLTLVAAPKDSEDDSTSSEVACGDEPVPPGDVPILATVGDARA